MKPRLRSSSWSTPTRAPAGILTSLSRIALRTTAPSPMWTSFISTESSTTAPASTREAGDRLDEGVAVEHVVAHAGQDLVGAVGEADRVGGLLQELADRARVRRVDVDHPELVGHRDRLADGRDGAGGAAVDVLLDHLREVHAVDVVGADDHDDVGLVVVDQVQRLVDRVGAAEVPVLADALLGRDARDVVAQER